MPSSLPRFAIPDAAGRRKRVGQSRSRKLWLLLLGALTALYLLVVFHQRFLTMEKVWLPPFHYGKPVTLVFTSEALRRVWKWEVESGHYPSGHALPKLHGFTEVLLNPARPPNVHTSDGFEGLRSTGIGPERVYLYPSDTQTSNGIYPPRPIRGSAADMDTIMRHCDYSAGKYVRDCLKLLRRGASLDNTTTGRDFKQNCKYIYVHDTGADASHRSRSSPSVDSHTEHASLVDESITRRKRFWTNDEHDIPLPPVRKPSAACDENDPRIFHMFWQGSFTDKPYMAILSFLYTQNLGLDQETSHPGYSPPSLACRPQLWMWMYQHQWSAHTPDEWEAVMIAELKRNVWAQPFFHARFRDVVHFKVWDGAAQVEATPEFHDSWTANRKKPTRSLTENASEKAEGIFAAAVHFLSSNSHSDANTTNPHALRARTPPSVADYDRASVAESDFVRFVLCHRYGGVYLDVDVLLLRDWEELWGWQGAFGYRWSRMDRYNTAVLRLHKQSALGSWLLRTAYKNGMSFHPIRITRYLKDAQMEELLFRAPVALFDPAWLNAEGFEVDRPPQPYFSSFDDFFVTPPEKAAQPEALGFNGFFKGAFVYHYHNQWWTPFDPARDYPDLGSRYTSSHEKPRDVDVQDIPTDLSWSAMLKRTFEAYVRGEQPNMYGEYIRW